MMTENYLRDLNLTTDEICKLGNAFSDSKFRQLFGQYLCEINDRENLQHFNEHIIQLERQYGNDVELLEPVPGYVLKTSADGCKKVYINICSHENVNRPEYRLAVEDNTPGRNILIPHALLPVQNVREEHNEQVTVYSVVFHPQTLEKAFIDNQIKEFVNEIALTSIEKSFEVNLDKVNFRVSKKTFKGTAQLTTIQKTDGNDTGPIHEVKTQCDTISVPLESNQYVTPVHRIKYRNEVDLQDSTTSRYCKLNALMPKEMLIEIELPLLKSIGGTQLDVQANSIALLNENPRYKLHIDLPYEIDAVDSSAKFISDTRILSLELKVRKKMSTNLSASNEAHEIPASNLITEISSQQTTGPSFNGVAADDVKCSIPTSSSQPSTSKNPYVGSMCRKATGSQFLDTDVKYKLPPFDCNLLQHKLAFTMFVKNVNSDSFVYQIFDKRDGFWVKFCSLGGGHFPMFFALCVVFEADVDAVVSITYSVDNEKVHVYLQLGNDFSPLKYWVGIDQRKMENRYLSEPDAVALEVEDKKMEGLEVDLGVSKFSLDEVVIDVSLRPDCPMVIQPLQKSSGQNAATSSNGFLTSSPTGHTPIVFDNFETFNQNKTQEDGREMKLEKLDFGLEEFAQTTNFGTFCDGFKKRFSLDEDVHCLSESELLSSRSSTRAGNKTTTKTASLSNGSWITESKNAKKARRQKKARDKKLAISANNHRCSSKYPVTGGESETECTDSPKAADGSFDSTADVKSAYKFSALTSRSILKKHRSFSESSGDELCTVECSRSYSIEDINLSPDLYSQSVPKKHVRFNDVILKKLYSSDISILEQRKRSRRRFQRKERKASDSDNSETETCTSLASKKDNIRLFNENLFGENSDIEVTSLSESSGETSDDQSDNPDGNPENRCDIPCSKKNHKRRGKKSARKNASTAKHQYQID